MKTVFSIKSKYWAATVISIAIIGILLILYDNFFNSIVSLNIGVLLFSLSGIMIGLEAIVKRKIILSAPYHKRLSDTYIGIATIAQGLLIILTGCFLIGLLTLNYLNEGRNLFHHFVKHPGIPLLFLSVFCFLTAVTAIIGSLEDKQGLKFLVILNLLTSRFLAGTILILLGIFFLCAGILEIINPNYFDSIGGGFLEVLFLSQQSK